MLASAREILTLLEAGDAAAVDARLATRHAGWPVTTFLRDSWFPQLDDLAGAGRSVAAERAVDDRTARFELRGERGTAFVTVRLDDDGRLDGLSVRPDDRDGIASVVLAAPDDLIPAMRAFYDGYLHGRRNPNLVFDEGEHHTPPPPDQLHVELTVPDVTATDLVHDPAGHPVRLVPGDERGIRCVVLDCDEPEADAAFWAALLDMPERVVDEDDRIEIARADGAPPNLAFRRVDGYLPPTWPDPRRHQQGHLDVHVDDRDAAVATIERLGGRLLPAQGGSCPVYADPAGHPFCLCRPGE